jgi:outer membrane protein TolC
VGRHCSVLEYISIASILLLGASAIGAQTLPTPPLLTEQEAVLIARSANRQIKSSALDVDEASQSIWEAKTGYLPQSNLAVTVGHHIGDVTFTIPEGTFGSYSATGPIPGSNYSLNGGHNFTDQNSASVTESLAQLYATHLSVMIASTSRALAEETMRLQRHNTVAQVRQAYHQICILEAALDTDRDQKKSLTEVAREVDNSVGQGTALRAESLQAHSALAQLRYTEEKDEDALLNAKEQLNLLLARDVDTSFEVEPLLPMDDEESDLDTARTTALRERPEIRLAQLQIDKANLDVRQEKANYIPVVNAEISYRGFRGEDFLPKTDITTGISLRWQNPWDWGNRKARINSLRDVSKQQKLSCEDRQQQVLLDVDQKFRSLKEARLLVSAGEAAKDASAENLRNVSNQFRQHTALLSDVLRQAVDDRKQSEAYTQALGAYWTARADFDRALGRN